MLNFNFLSDVNYLHVFVAGFVYWVLGAIWYMAVFSKPWAAGLEKWGHKMSKPGSGTMMKKMIVSLICNIGAAFFLAWFIRNESLYNNAIYGAKIGFTAGMIAVMAFSTGDNWLSKPRSTYLVDATYHIIGLTLCGVILGAWH